MNIAENHFQGKQGKQLFWRHAINGMAIRKWNGSLLTWVCLHQLSDLGLMIKIGIMITPPVKTTENEKHIPSLTS
jgi:hypothetical protein